MHPSPQDKLDKLREKLFFIHLLQDLIHCSETEDFYGLFDDSEGDWLEIEYYPLPTPIQLTQTNQ